MAYRLLDNSLLLFGIPCSSLLSGSTGAGHLREPSQRLRLLDPLPGLDLDLLWHFLGLGLEMMNHSGQGILEVQHALLDGLELRVLGDGLVHSRPCVHLELLLRAFVQRDGLSWV